MPSNRFPDTPEKRELRRRDRRRIEQVAAARAIPRLQYCGMPSVEYLDVIEWRDYLRSVMAVEYDPEVLSDMRIQWGKIGRELGIPMDWELGNILDFLSSTPKT